MNKKNYALILVAACLIALSGLVFLFDALDIAFEGAMAKWYLVVLLFLSAEMLAIAIIRNAPIYYTICSIFAGVFLSMSMGKAFSECWALIPISLSIGMMITHWTSHGRLKYLTFAVIMLILSIILLVGGITHSWQYVVPIELIVVGVITIIYVCVKLFSNNKNGDNDDDYHVRPTNENEIK